MSLDVKGRCLCGAVTFKAKIQSQEVGVCHCGMCRRWSGGAFLCVTADGPVKFESKDHLGLFKSSEWGERGFCKQCGSSLFWRAQDGSMTVISAHSIDDLADASLSHEIFIEDKPAYYNFAEPTTKMTGAEVMAMFAPKDA